MILSKRSEIVVSYGLADVCWFVGVVLAIMAGQPYGADAFWLFGGLGLWCLIHGTQVWSEHGRFPFCRPDAHPCCASLMRNLAATVMVFLGLGVLGTPLWLVALYLAQHRGF